MYETFAKTVNEKRCFFVVPAGRYLPGLRIGVAKYDEGDAWASAEKAATRHFRKIHRGEPRIIVREWVDELGCDAWVVRKAVQSETNT